ncbi:hypothetical protein CBR_g36970 [Chara braunii]|uniref:Reverse transcriptase domain-containing protein n=1 Tax=Chara braunii TaxID=69332 RepID=A0A388JZJ0_CHABU|nr:hypothetical protein CBR_g36970 [Chara braunii]|eukprot:GBG63202.1 hypothetical protein CBR_g36970 [Chara braunii]
MSAQKTTRRGRPRLTPSRLVQDNVLTEANDRFQFVKLESKRLRALKKAGLEALCQQEGIDYKTVEATADELAELRATARFGKCFDCRPSVLNDARYGESEGVYRDAVLNLVLAGEIPWGAKLCSYLKRVRGECLDFATCTGPLVYVNISAWTKHMYVGATSRSLEVRWRERVFRVRNVEVIETERRNERLYKWLRRCGLENYVALPLLRCSSVQLFELGWFLIRLISPHLNCRNRPKKFRKCRAGKRERRRKWGRVVKKGIAVQSTHSFKPLLTKFLSHPPQRKDLLSWDLDKLVCLYSAVRSFSEKRSRYSLRCILSGVIRRKFGVNVRCRLVVKIVYDVTLRKASARKLAAGLVMQLSLSEEWKRMILRRMRVVWIKNKSIGDILHNFRDAARLDEVQCDCERMDEDLPRVDGHVCFRPSEVDFVPTRLKNSKNIPRPSSDRIIGSLKSQVLQSFDYLLQHSGTSRGELAAMMTRDTVLGCFNGMGCEMGSVCKTEDVERWKCRFGNLVCCPIDHNPGDSLLCCRVSYREGMDKMFLSNVGFELCDKDETESNDANGRRYKECGFQKLGRWNGHGKVGKCYIIPKHKDVRKWRPICPLWEECGVTASKRIARAVNQMLWSLPMRSNFNMKSTEELMGRIALANKELKAGEGFVSAAFDIKEMFCNLPHVAVIEAVRWVVDFWTAEECKGVMVRARGKGTKMKLGKSQVGWQTISFDVIVKFVEFELSCTYINACGKLLRQHTGIPMGKSSSPALACLLSAYSEFMFLSALGSMRPLTYGARIVDDVSIFVRYTKGDAISKQAAEGVIRVFKDCYNENLTLERTDSGPFWQSLGCVVGVCEGPEGIVSAATHKNQAAVHGGRLIYQNLQDFCTYSSREQKLAVVSSFLYRAKKFTTMVGAEAIFLLTLKIELRKRGFPDCYFDSAVRTFSDKFGGIWEEWVVCLTGWDVNWGFAGGLNGSLRCHR